MRARLREFWPEAAFLAFLGLFLFTRAKDGPLFVAFCIFVAGLGWAMGIRHRSLSLHKKVDRMTDGVGEMLTEMRAGRAEEETARPHLFLVRRD